jgi:hypothetical protein
VDNNPPRWVNGFDFDICRNYYSIDNDTSEQISFYKFSDVWKMQTSLKSCAYMLKTRETTAQLIHAIERYIKYAARGIIFTGDLHGIIGIVGRIASYCRDFRLPSLPIISVEETVPDEFYDYKFFKQQAVYEYIYSCIKRNDPFWIAVCAMECGTQFPANIIPLVPRSKFKRGMNIMCMLPQPDE